MFTAALFTVARTWNLPKCPLQRNGKEDVVHIYNGILLSLSTPGYVTEENENINSKRYMHPSVYSRIIYSSQDMEAR